MFNQVFRPFQLLSMLVLISMLSILSCARNHQTDQEDLKTFIDNRHVFALLLQETLETDSLSQKNYDHRILVDTTGAVPLVSLLYQVDHADSVVDMRVLYANTSLYAKTAMEHLKTTEDRIHTEGWHYQQWSFEVPR